MELYLNQEAVWKSVTGRNEYGEPLTEEADIKVRWEGKRRLVRNAQGQEVVSEARVFCLEPVKPGDILVRGSVGDEREWPVIAVAEIPDINGAVQYREVAV